MITYKELIAAQTLTAIPASYYKAPAATQVSIQACTLNNPTGAPVTVNVYRTPGPVVVSSIYLIGSRVVPAGATVSLHEVINHKLAPDSEIYATGLGCAINMSGIEYIPVT